MPNLDYHGPACGCDKCLGKERKAMTTLQDRLRAAAMSPDAFDLPDLMREAADALDEREAIHAAALSIDADLSGNSDSRQRGTFTMIETNRVQRLLDALASREVRP